MGWLGWTEQQTLDTSMPAIVLAYEGRQDMIRVTLERVFGPAEPAPDDDSAEPAEPVTLKVSDIRNTFRRLAG
jgi:hypothetical protein